MYAQFLEERKELVTGSIKEFHIHRVRILSMLPHKQIKNECLYQAPALFDENFKL